MRRVKRGKRGKREQRGQRGGKEPGVLACLALWSFVSAVPIQAQSDTAAYRVTVGQVASVGTGLVLAAVPSGVSTWVPPECAPCDPNSVPPFDRWVIRPVLTGWAVASDVTLVTLFVGTWLDLAQRPNGVKHVAASAEAAAWMLGISQLTKMFAERLRPVMYTEDARDAASEITSQRSFPSGHTSMAFALATSFWLSTKGDPALKRWLVMGGAVTVGVMRVAAAEHFPSDVLVGAALGTATAIVVHEVRF